MRVVPSGWSTIELGEALLEPLANGRSVPDRPGGFPVLRLTAVRDRRIDLEQCKAGAWSANEARPYLVCEGDLLIVRGNGSLHLIGRAGVVGAVTAPVAYPDTLIRVRTDPALIESRYMSLLWDSPAVRDQIEDRVRTTAGIYKVNQSQLRSVKLPVPSLDEQRRIVDILEDHLSRLDAAAAYLDAAVRRQRSLTASVLTTAIPDISEYPAHWQGVTVADAGHLELGRQRHPDWHHGPNMHPYLRVANVFEDRIDTSDVKEMHWTGDTFERFQLHPGDVLLNEGQSPEWLGRPAIYRGDPPEVAFTNSLIRFMANPDVLPEFALLVFRRHMHAGRFRRESRITTNIAHLSASRLKSVEFPIPPTPEQERLVEDVTIRLDAVATVIDQVRIGQARARSLRRALLAAAFSGRLTGRASDMDLAEELVTSEAR